MEQNLADLWFNTEVKPGTYKFGEKNHMKFMLFLAENGFTQVAWDYWMTKVGSKDPIERMFIEKIIKYRFIIRRMIIMQSLTASIQESADGLNLIN